MPHKQNIKVERKKIDSESFYLDGSCHRTEGAAFISATPQDKALESQHRQTQLTQHATHENKTKFYLLYAKGRSAQPGVFWRTHHIKPDPKPMGVILLCLWEV